MPKVHDVQQGSSEWLNLRAGIPTASEFDKIITPSGKPSASTEKYMFRLLAERIMQHPVTEAVSFWMQRGNELEEEAVGFYELTRDMETVSVGFVTNDEGTIGASPDRLVGEDGLLEIKVPSEPVHVSYLLKKAVDQAYYPQVQGQLWVTGRAWVDILSYHPEMPPALIRVDRDEQFIELLSNAVSAFSEQLEEYSRQLIGRGWIKAWPIPIEIQPIPQTSEADEFLRKQEEDIYNFGESLAQQRAEGPGMMAEHSTEPPGMIPPDFSDDIPPPCPKCGSETRLIGPGISKHWKPQWGTAKWRCKSCPKRTKGCGVDAAQWHEQLQQVEVQAEPGASG